MAILKTLFVCIILCCPFFSFSQDGDCTAQPDTVCVNIGDPINYNVLTNDGISPDDVCSFQLETPNECVGIEGNGFMFPISNDEICCGEYELVYFYIPCGSENPCFSTVSLTIKCPKPECFLVDLEQFFEMDDPIGGPPADCVYACENSDATYYVSFNPSNTYLWNVSGGTYTTGSNAAEIIVTWGPGGAGTISLTIIEASNTTSVFSVCVDILEGPVADFSASDSSVCLNSPVSFINNSIGGTSYVWDFGDGNSSTMFSPTHTYSNPGTYTATLYATKNNYDGSGNPLCCCSDSTSLEIEVDSLEGPNIYWISTLCANDSSKYWTDATNCSNYNWSVLDENGLPVSFDGQGNDTICVGWGSGPFGTITLDATGCDSAYCDEPVTAIVPIIPPSVLINGPVEVCENSNATYTVPKWLSVYYDWMVTGGTIVSGQGTNSVIIHWTSGTGTINLNYSSNFLGGLPGHVQEDCDGAATLSVNILPEFDVNGPSPAIACLNSSSSYFATASPSAAYNWTITPSVSFTGQGTNFIVATWDNGPGTFKITAQPIDTTAYCNDEISLFMQVIELAEPDSITGPVDVCPGETATYFGHSSESGTGFSWNVIGGSPSSFIGDPLIVTWNPSGPYSISLKQFQINSPFCVSDTIQLSVNQKAIAGPLSIGGVGTCINGVGSYSLSPVQHPDAVINWSIAPVTSGSVVSGQGTDSIQIQWNNTAGPVVITASVTLCGITQTTTLSLVLNAAPPPIITQSGPLCPGDNVTLDAGAGYASYSWSTGDLTQTTTINSGGTYTVTVIDANSCTATGSFDPIVLPSPVASISTPDFLTLCTVPPNADSVVISAQTNPNYIFAWYCDGILQGPPSTQATFTHINTNVPGVFSYHVVVTDITTGCDSTSNTIVVIQTDDCDSPPGCTPANHTINVTSNNQMPDCNIVDFTASFSGPVNLIGWNFDDPANNINTGTTANAIHAYTKAGYFTAELSYSVPEAAPGTGNCTLAVFEPVCIPLAADFDCVDTCQTIYFNDLSTFLPGNDITNWIWDFGDFNFSASPNPVHTYALPGTYTVTLVVGNVNGCQATFTKTVVVTGPPNPSMTINPSPACVGDSVGFSGSGTGIVSWLWKFGDGSENGGQNPSHSYLSANTYLVTLTGTDVNGCLDSVSQSLLINPLPPDDSISYAPSLTICEGNTVTLTAPPGPYTYLWSTGAVTPSITTGVAGSYSVVVTDINGCSMEPDPVEVTVYPKPDALISGPSFICDDGCVTLSSSSGFSYTYQWLDDLNAALIGQTFQDLTVCDFNLLPGYQVIVTDGNGCSDTSTIHSVGIAVSPSIIVNVAPDSCEGSPSTLSVVPIQPNVTYSWSNGGSGGSITVSLAGTYSVIGTDTLTGCTGSASAVIHPLPDLCLVPAGCYEACNPDTICGPPGLASYQWNLSGVPISGETGQCIIVTQSGTYSLTGTTDFGCSLTSDSLILELIECDSTICDMVAVQANPVSDAIDSCCWSLDLSNLVDNYFIGVSITALNGVGLGYNGSTAGWNLAGSSSSHVDLLPPLLGFIPTGSFTGVLNDVADFCLTGYADSIQKVVISWLIPGTGPSGFAIACSDTLEFDCEPEGCIEILEDSIYCQGDTIKYTFTVQNKSFTHTFQSIKLNIDSTLNISMSPDPLNVPPIPPLSIAGPFTVCITGPDAVFGDSLKFYLSAHDSLLLDGTIPTFCCSDTLDRCIPFPPCDPCEETEVLAEKDSVECCYTISLVNNFSASYFTGLQTEILTPGATFGTITGAFPLGWVYTQNAPNDLSWKRVPLGSGIPIDTTLLPKICLDGDYPDSVILVVNWLTLDHSGIDSIACSDTLLLLCDPSPDPCVYLLHDSIYCDADGKYYFDFQIVNNSGYDIDKLEFVGLTPFDVNIDSILLVLADGDTSSILTTCITGPGAVAGAEVCFRITLHDLLEGGDFLNCCTSDTTFCYVLPPCDSPCGPGFIKDDFVVIPPLTSVTIDILLNDVCPAGSVLDPSSVVIINPPVNGSIVNINPITGEVTYEHGSDLTGLDCFIYEVCCINDDGSTICCTAEVCIEVEPFIDPCNDTSIPSGVSSSVNPSGTSVALSWDAIPGAAAYQIKGRPVGSTGYGTLVKTSNFANVGGLLSGTCYEWKIRVGCEPLPSVIGPFSPHYTFCTPSLSRNLLEKSGFQVELIPNPVIGLAELRITSDHETSAGFIIFDVTGKEVFRFDHHIEKNDQLIELDVSFLNSGVYMLQIKGDSVFRSLQFVKIDNH